MKYIYIFTNAIKLHISLQDIAAFIPINTFFVFALQTLQKMY